MQSNSNYREMEHLYQLRQRLETPVSSYKDSTYVNETMCVYSTNAKSLNTNRNQDAASPIYSNTSIEQYRPNSQSSYTSAMTYGESLSHLRHSIGRNTNNQGNIRLKLLFFHNSIADTHRVFILNFNFK